MDPKVAKSFDTKVSTIVKSKSPTLCISSRKNKILISGSQNLVNLIQSNDDLTVKELCKYMVQNMELTDVYLATSPLIFPKLTCKFKGSNWTFDVARANLQTMMTILGFGHGGTKQYKNIADKPEGWPSNIDFASVKHPSYLTISQTNTIIQSLLEHHAIDPYTFFNSDTGVFHPPKPKKPRKTSANSASTISNEDNYSATSSASEISDEPLVSYVPEIVPEEQLNVLDFELY